MSMIVLCSAELSMKKLFNHGACVTVFTNYPSDGMVPVMINMNYAVFSICYHAGSILQEHIRSFFFDKYNYYP